ncbi:MAG: sugar phosphate isomerase/epimerase family protein [Candidatus Spyradocola sp.]|jgi:sugar phosphate isomerase/epimerase
MYTVLDASMLGIQKSLSELAPLCAAQGIAGMSAPAAVLDDPRACEEAAALFRDLGLRWGLMPMTADFYAWGLEDDAFEEALRALEKRACAAEKLGARWAYNHVWSSGPRPFDENFEWHVRRVARVSRVLADHGIRYGLEFLGPHELQRLQPHPFVHTLAGVLAIADAAGGTAGLAFDTFHWYCGTNGDKDDLLYAVQHADRVVALHLNDAVAGVPFDQQRDMERRMPMETGVIDAKEVCARFQAAGYAGPCMIEPFEPARTRLAAMSAQEAVAEAAAAFRRLGLVQ